jgi:hypothetical protein
MELSNPYGAGEGASSDLIERNKSAYAHNRIRGGASIDVNLPRSRLFSSSTLAKKSPRLH